MDLLTNFAQYLNNLSQKQFKQYVAGLFIIIMLLTGAVLFHYYQSVGKLKAKLTTINKTRREVQNILERHDLVKKQQADVDVILAQEKNFKISQFFEKVIDSAAISSNQIKSMDTSSDEKLDGYIEWTLDAVIDGLNTKKLTELLNVIEQEERVYTKEINITKARSGNAINVSLAIATLEPKTVGKE